MNRSLLHRLLLDTREDEIGLIPGQEMRLDAMRNLAVLRLVTPVAQLIAAAFAQWALEVPTLSPLLFGVFGL